MHFISYILVYARKMRPSSLACDEPFLVSQTLEISLGYHGKRSRYPGAGAHFPAIFCEHFHQPLCRAFLWIGFTGTVNCIEAEIGCRLPRSVGRLLVGLGWGSCRHKSWTYMDVHGSTSWKYIEVQLKRAANNYLLIRQAVKFEKPYHCLNH